MRIIALLFFLLLATPALAQAPLDEARAAIGEGRYEDAIGLLEPLVAAEPGNAAAWNALGAANNYASRYRQANEAAERAVALDPSTARYRFNRALTRWEVGDFEGALADHSFVLEQQPNNAAALTERGTALLSLGRPDEAQASWAASLDADPNYIWAHFYRGHAEMVQGRYAEAAASFARVLEREDFYPARLWLWAARASAGQQAPELAPQDEWPGAIGDFLTGRISARALERAAREQRLDIDQRRLASARYFIGMKALADGDQRRARRYFRAALSLNVPNHAELIAAHAELERLD